MKSKHSAVNEVINAEKFVDQLLEEGTKIGCKEPNFSDKHDLPPFYDEKLYKKGQEFFYKHIWAMFFAKFNGLLAVLAIPPVLKILIFTQKSGNNYSAYVRYMSTIFHMLVWYREDFKPGSNLWKSLSEVNSKHSYASKKSCSAGLNNISQKDMALTQFGFMGFQLCRPEQIGIHHATKEELQAFTHVWRVVGYLMGIEDRFNICSGSVEETKEICNLLIDKCFYPAISQRDPDYLKMSSHLCGGLWSMNPFLIHKVIMNYLFEVKGGNYVDVSGLTLTEPGAWTVEQSIATSRVVNYRVARLRLQYHFRERRAVCKVKARAVLVRGIVKCY